MATTPCNPIELRKVLRRAFLINPSDLTESCASSPLFCLFLSPLISSVRKCDSLSADNANYTTPPFLPSSHLLLKTPQCICPLFVRNVADFHGNWRPVIHGLGNFTRLLEKSCPNLNFVNEGKPNNNSC